MKNTIDINNSLNQVMVVVPCVLTAIGIAQQLRSETKIKASVNVINKFDEAYAGILKEPHSLIILNISENSKRLAEEVNFINWCRTAKPNAVIVAYTRNQKLSVLNYISSLGVRVIISQYESPVVFTELILKSLSTDAALCSPMIKSILEGKIAGELTLCEVQVIGQLFSGRNVTQIAQNLGRDIRTVSAHKRHAMEKLGLHCEKDLHVLGCELTGK